MSRDAFGDRQTVLACLDTLEATQRRLADCSLDGFSHDELVGILARRETMVWRNPVLDQRILARLIAEANPGDLGAASLAGVLSERLRISRGDAGRRVNEAADLAPRTTLTGEVLDPVLPALAAAQAAGAIGPEHIKIARKAYQKIPPAVTGAERETVEADLAAFATEFGPTAFEKLADHLIAVLDPDGDYTDRERQAKRSLRLGKQGPDGMSTLHATITPELRATLEPVLAKLAAPGMCNAADESPCISGTPTEAQILADDRTIGQRHHDALQAMTRALLAAGDLGQLNGLPVTVIVTTTLAELTAAAHTNTPAPAAAPAAETQPAAEPETAPETEPEAETAPEPEAAPAPAPAAEPALEPEAELAPETTPEPEADTDTETETEAEAAGAGAEVADTAPDPEEVTDTTADPPIDPPPPKPLTGRAITAGGTLLPMADLLRMASHAHHYLTIFDGHGRALWLGRTKRIATADQRIVLHARDRGCTRPGCTVSGYHTQAHHLAGWLRDGLTEPDNLALACGPDNRMENTHNWTTQLNNQGRVEWIPPPHLDRGQPRTNPYHFIEDLLDYHRKTPTPDTQRGDPPEPPESTAPNYPPPQDDYPWLDDPLPGDPEYDRILEKHRRDDDAMDYDAINRTMFPVSLDV